MSVSVCVRACVRACVCVYLSAIISSELYRLRSSAIFVRVTYAMARSSSGGVAICYVFLVYG